MKQFKQFFNKIKEEKWLNDKLSQGYRLSHISPLGLYSFEASSESYVLRIDCQESLSKDKYLDYLTTYEDFGWEYVYGSKSSQIHYWQKKASKDNHLFSDRQSFAHYYKRMMYYSISFAVILWMLNAIILKDSALYATQGLWDMEGSLFWLAFLFETPFVIIKLLPGIMGCVCLITAFKNYQAYQKMKDL